MRKVVVLVVVAALLAVSGWFFGPQLAGWAGAAWTSVVDGKGQTRQLLLYGNVDIRKVDLAFRVAGRIETLAVQEGDAVSPGQVVAALEATPYEEDVREAEATVQAAKATLARLEAGFRTQEIATQEAVVAERRATLDNARHQLERQRELLRTSTASRQAFDNALAAEKEASARLESANRRLQLLRSGSRKEEIAEATANVTAAKVRLERAKTRLSDTVLLAPEAGVVLTRAREPGAVVATGQTVFTVALTDPVWVRAYVSEPNLGRIRPGMEASVFSDSRPDQAFRAQVGFISPQAEFTPKNVETTDQRTDLVYRLRLVVDDPQSELRQGMPVTVRFAVEAAPEG
jgi:HlyD family secretion protein